MQTLKNHPRKRILLVDDHPLVRKGLAEALMAEGDMEICGEAEGWRDALRLLPAQRPDIIILDLNLKDGNGWHLLDNIKSNPDIPPVLILSVCDEEIYAERLLRAGAMGYLMKDAALTDIVKAIRKIFVHQVAVSDKIATALINRATLNHAPNKKNELDILSNREIQVMELLRAGIGNLEIAERIGISPKTVSTYKARLMEKLGVRTTPDLLMHLEEQAECRKTAGDPASSESPDT